MDCFSDLDCPVGASCYSSNTSMTTWYDDAQAKGLLEGLRTATMPRGCLCSLYYGWLPAEYGTCMVFSWKTWLLAFSYFVMCFCLLQRTVVHGIAVAKFTWSSRTPRQNKKVIWLSFWFLQACFFGFLQFTALALAMVSPKAERISCLNRICTSALSWVEGITASLLLLLLALGWCSLMRLWLHTAMSFPTLRENPDSAKFTQRINRMIFLQEGMLVCYVLVNFLLKFQVPTAFLIFVIVSFAILVHITSSALLKILRLALDNLAQVKHETKDKSSSEQVRLLDSIKRIKRTALATLAMFGLLTASTLLHFCLKLILGDSVWRNFQNPDFLFGDLVASNKRFQLIVIFFTCLISSVYVERLCINIFSTKRKEKSGQIHPTSSAQPPKFQAILAGLFARKNQVSVENQERDSVPSQQSSMVTSQTVS